MKTKEQKRQEVTLRKGNILIERLEIGVIKQLENRLQNLSKKPGESKKEKARILKLIEDFSKLESQKTMSVKELKQESKKSKVGK